MEVQPQLVLLQKTLLYVEGVGRQLYPQLDLWKTAKPFLESRIKDQVGIPALVRSLKEKGPFWIEKCLKFLNWFTTVCVRARTFSTAWIKSRTSFNPVACVRAVPLSRNWRDAADKRHVAVDQSSGLGNDASTDYGCRCGCLACWLEKNALN